ncbi:MAG: hypothetical protein JNK02_09985 [Planctomycetes bacterium]|nr:hypothetical protein [Planctomycetota bacterium]
MTCSTSWSVKTKAKILGTDYEMTYGANEARSETRGGTLLCGGGAGNCGECKRICTFRLLCATTPSVVTDRRVLHVDRTEQPDVWWVEVIPRGLTSGVRTACIEVGRGEAQCDKACS